MSTTHPTEEVAATADTPSAPAGNAVVRFFKSHPTAFWFFFWGEFAERCCYYGMRVILALYMTERLGVSQANAGTFMSVFIGACYLLPLLGGWIADNYFGKYWTIVGFSIPYIVGQLLVGIENQYVVVGALALLAMGSGVIKPNISTLMGLTYDQQRPGQELLRSEAFSMFYFAINVGAFISQSSLPTVRDYFGYQVAFLIPAVLMGIALTIFAAGKRFYGIETIERKRLTSEEKRERWNVLGRIAGLFVLVMFFWAVFDQSASTWVFFAKTYMNCQIFGRTIAPDAVQAANALFIIIMLPLVMFLWRFLAGRGIKIRPTDKMIAGFLLTALSMGVMAAAGAMAGPVEPTKRAVMKDGQPVTEEVEVKQADGTVVKGTKPVEEEWVKDENKVSVWWQILAYFVITIAEILISVTGLELAFVVAPKSMSSFVTGCWLAVVFLANILINAPLTQLYPRMTPTVYFGAMAVTLLVVAGVFVLIAKRFNEATAKGAQPA